MSDINEEANKNFKHKFDVMYNSWLGLGDKFQTFEEQDDAKLERDMQEIRTLIDEDDDEEQV